MDIVPGLSIIYTLRAAIRTFVLPRGKTPS